MVPVGAEETLPVKQTLAETIHKTQQASEDVEHQAYQEEMTKVNEVFNVFAQRARVANKFKSMLYVNKSSNYMDVVIVQLGDKEYYQPMVYLSKTDDDKYPDKVMIASDGSLHLYVHELDEGLHTISLPDKNGNRHPLFPGAETDGEIAKHGDRIPTGSQITLEDQRKLGFGITTLNLKNSAYLKEIRENLTRTAGLAKKLVTGEAVPKA